jgi:hypothetical protein
MLMNNFVSPKSLAKGANGDGAISRVHNIKIIRNSYSQIFRGVK